jgi:uncharacterized phage protein (TIGR02218 family)
MASICDGPLTSLAFCWTIERSDGAGIALTSGDRQLSCGGIAYHPEPGITPAAITRSLGMEPHSAEMSGALDAQALTESDLLLGRWDTARISVAAVDWNAPDEQAVQLLGGELGEVSLSGDSFTAELNGAAAKLSAPVCPSTSAECRAELGDKKCRVDLAGRTVRARVVSAENNLIVTDQPLDGRYAFGRLRYLSGANCGVQSVVLAVNGTQVTLRDRARATVEPDTVVEVREGCDKLFATCVSRFANAVNFRGEPHVPGNDLLTRYP